MHNGSMTLRARKTLLGSFLVMQYLLGLGLAAFLVYWAMNQSWELDLHSEPFLLVPFLLPIIVQFLSAAFASHYLRRTYGKTASSEVFFLALAMALVPLESLRFLHYVILSQDLPLFWITFLQRFLLLVRYFWGGALLVGSLYSLGFPYQKLGHLLVLILTLSTLLALQIPLATLELNSALRHPFLDPVIHAVITAVLGILPVLVYVLAWRKNHNREQLFLGLGILATYTGAILMGGNYPVAAVLFLPAVIFLGRTTQRLYLWL